MQAPETMAVAVHPDCCNEFAYQNIPSSQRYHIKHGHESKWHTYHLARHNQPFSDREFLMRLQLSDIDSRKMHEAIYDWLRGEYQAAMEALE